MVRMIGIRLLVIFYNDTLDPQVDNNASSPSHFEPMDVTLSVSPQSVIDCDGSRGCHPITALQNQTLPPINPIPVRGRHRGCPLVTALQNPVQPPVNLTPVRGRGRGFHRGFLFYFHGSKYVLISYLLAINLSFSATKVGCLVFENIMCPPAGA